MASPSPDFIASDEGFALATWQSVVVSVWRQQPTVERATAAHQSTRDLLRVRPGGIGYLQVIESRCPPPEGLAREPFLRIIRDGQVRCAAVVAEGGGFQGSIVRGVVTGMIQIVRPAFPLKIFDGAAEGAGWLTRLVPGCSASDLVTTIEVVRRAVGRPRSALAGQTSG